MKKSLIPWIVCSVMVLAVVIFEESQVSNLKTEIKISASAKRNNRGSFGTSPSSLSACSKKFSKP
jgi:hypothetical protein